MSPCPTETNICALFGKSLVESISGDRLCAIEQIFVFALLSRRKCGSMIAQWKLVLRLSGAEEGTPPPAPILRMGNLLRSSEGVRLCPPTIAQAHSETYLAGWPAWIGNRSVCSQEIEIPVSRIPADSRPFCFQKTWRVNPVKKESKEAHALPLLWRAGGVPQCGRHLSEQQKTEPCSMYAPLPGM